MLLMEEQMQHKFSEFLSDFDPKNNACAGH